MKWRKRVYKALERWYFHLDYIIHVVVYPLILVLLQYHGKAIRMARSLPKRQESRHHGSGEHKINTTSDVGKRGRRKREAEGGKEEREKLEDPYHHMIWIIHRLHHKLKQM